jgi:hypothetical protein
LVSLELVNSLWHYWGAGQHSILRREDSATVRQYEIQSLRTQLVNGEALERIFSPNHPYVLYELVFDPVDHNPQSEGDLPAWTWLAPVLLDSLRRDSTMVAVSVASLISAREHGPRREPWRVDGSVLMAIFGNDASEVIDRLELLANQINETDQRLLVAAIAETGRITLAGSQMPTGNP